MERILSHITEDDSQYPSGFSRLDSTDRPDRLTVLGDLKLLEHHPRIALLSSRRCPGPLILKAYDVAVALRDAGVCVLSGFHSAMEYDALPILLRGKQPVIWFEARAIERMRLKREWRTAIEEERLVIVSALEDGSRRVSKPQAHLRNRCVAAMSDALLVVHAAEGSGTLGVVEEAHGWGKRVYALEDEANERLFALGVEALWAEDVGAVVDHGI